MALFVAVQHRRQPLPNEGFNVAWVYAIPPWLFAMGVIAGMSLLAGGGLVVVRRSNLQNPDWAHNDVAGPIIGTIGTVLAVMLSFMVVTVWQEYDQAAATVQAEASAVADIYRLNGSLPEPTRTALYHSLRQYVALVIHDEWPRMRYGGQSDAAQQTAFEILRTVARFQPATPAEQNIQSQAIVLAAAFSDARRQRLFDNAQAIPIIMWIMMVFIAAITIGFCYLFRVRSFLVHMLMTVALAATIGAVFVLIAEFDLPFRGDLQLPPTPFVRLEHVTFTQGDI